MQITSICALFLLGSSAAAYRQPQLSARDLYARDLYDDLYDDLIARDAYDNDDLMAREAYDEDDLIAREADDDDYIPMLVARTRGRSSSAPQLSSPSTSSGGGTNVLTCPGSGCKQDCECSASGEVVCKARGTFTKEFFEKTCKPVCSCGPAAAAAAAPKSTKKTLTCPGSGCTQDCECSASGEVVCKARGTFTKEFFEKTCKPVCSCA